MLKSCIAAACIALFAVMARADEYPNRPIRIMIPLPAGSTTYVTSRLYAEQWSRILGVPVIIEPKPGAQGIVEARQLMQAKPDGYTAGYMLTTMVSPNSEYDALGMEYSTRLSQDEMYLTVSEASGIRTLKELVATHPALFGAVSLGARMAGARFARAAGLKAQFYPSTPQTAREDVRSGRVGYALLFNVDVRVGVARHELRPLAVVAPERSTFYPDVPTLAEAMSAAGLRPYRTISSYSALVFPPGTPAAIVRRFSEATCRAVKESDLRERIRKIGSTATCSTPQEMRALAERTYKIWAQDNPIQSQ